jgi:predicted ATPase
VLWLLGYPDHALRNSQDALALARELSHPSSMANAIFFAARVHQQRGEGHRVQARTEEGLAVAAEHGLPRWLAMETVLRGWLLVEQGQKQTGIVQMLKGMALERGGVTWDSYCSALLAEAYRTAGQSAEGINVVSGALATAHQTECRYYEAELYRIKGDLLLGQAVGDEAQAETCFQRAAEVSRRQEARSLELRAAMSLSRLWQKQGKTAEARQLLGGIYGWFTEGFDTADLRQARALLEELS